MIVTNIEVCIPITQSLRQQVLRFFREFIAFWSCLSEMEQRQLFKIPSVNIYLKTQTRVVQTSTLSFVGSVSFKAFAQEILVCVSHSFIPRRIFSCLQTLRYRRAGSPLHERILISFVYLSGLPCPLRSCHFLLYSATQKNLAWRERYPLNFHKKKAETKISSL